MYLSKIAIGKKIPAFTAYAISKKIISAQGLRGSPVVLYFYLKDNTPGCTQEGIDFRDNYAHFRRCRTRILAVSRDSLKSHKKFRTKYEFPFDLISDADEIHARFSTQFREKTMYGKTVLGIERSTFLIDSEGILRRE